MSNNDTIQAKVEEFVNDEEAFTSVDIANAIKRDGTWIRNRVVAAWLRDKFFQIIIGGSYSQTMISVGQGKQANLYHPYFFDKNNYTDKDQNALNPDDFNAIHPNTPVTPSTSVSDDSDSDEEQDFNEDSRTVSISLERLWIPSSIINQLGMKPGDYVDSIKLNLKNDPKLTVHHDGRVSASLKDVDPSFGDGDKIKIYVMGDSAVYCRA